MIIQEHWNKTVRKDWGGAKERDYISFSDLGKPYIDRFLKMTGIPVTNKFDERVLRIFDAGRVMEFIVLRALTMAGILNQKQTFVEIPATKHILKCLGYLDATIGGFTNWDKAKDIIHRHLDEYKLELDDQLIEQKAINIIEGLSKTYSQSMPEMLVEVKSINSMAFWAHKNRDKQGNFLGYPHNKLQLYGYMTATDIKRGILLYISKDDFVMEEMGIVLGNQKIDEMFKKDIREMSYFYKKELMPPKEQEIIYNEQKKKFELNWQVSRSGYLTKIYGYKDSEDFSDRNRSKLNEINLALKHLREFEKQMDQVKKARIEKKLKAEKEIIMHYNLKELK